MVGTRKKADNVSKLKSKKGTVKSVKDIKDGQNKMKAASKKNSEEETEQTI